MIIEELSNSMFPQKIDPSKLEIRIIKCFIIILNINLNVINNKLTEK